MLQKSINLQLRTNGLLNWFLLPRSNCLNDQPGFVKDLISSSIFTAYDHLRPEDFNTVNFEHNLMQLDRSKYRSKFLSPVLEISDTLIDTCGDYINDFILHGSLSTLDFIQGWSDFDSIVIIKDETLKDPVKMKKLRAVSLHVDRIIKKIDNHQHHGIHFIAEKDLLMYPDLYLPHNLFKNGTSLMGKSKILGKLRDSKKEQSDRFNSIYATFKNAYGGGALQHHAIDGVYLMNNFRNHSNGMYQLKYFLSVIVILPSYFMNIMGDNLSKSDSIIACRKIISENNFEIIDSATAIRNMWNTHPVVSNSIPDSVRKILGKNYFFRGYNLIREMKEHLGI